MHELEANRNLPASSSFTSLQQATGPPDGDWEMPLVDYPVAAVTRSLQTILRFPDGSISSTVNCPETCQSRQLSAQEIAATGAADISAFSLQTRSYPVIPASAELFERAAWVSVTWQSGAETLHYVQWEPRDFVGGEPSAASIFNLGISLATARPGLLKPTSFSSVPGSVGNPTCATLDTAAESASRFDRSSILEGFQDHHIISDKNALTKNHDLVGLAGFDLQSRANKIFLPTDAALHPTRSIHLGRHTTSVSRNLAEQMDAVVDFGRANNWTQPQYNDALRGIISQERQLLKSGERALNRNARPWAQ